MKTLASDEDAVHQLADHIDEMTPAALLSLSRAIKDRLDRERKAKKKK